MIQLGLIGKSLQHTLSPVIHGAFFDELGLRGQYSKIEIADPSGLPAALQQAADEGFLGLNVTIPYKIEIFAQLRNFDESATLACAVNTVKLSPEPYTGYNTDIGGLAEAIYRMDLDSLGAVSDRTAVILGSGGAARAAVIAVSTLGYKKLQIIGRRPEAARAMLDEILATAQRQTLVANCRGAQICDFDGAPADASAVGLVINATPIGQKANSVPDNIVRLMDYIGGSGKAFVDLVYSKTETPLCKTAREAGFELVEDGKEMLVNQARLAFKIWTGQLPEGQLARERLGAL